MTTRRSGCELDSGAACAAAARSRRARAPVDVALSALDEHRLLCAHRRGPFGVAHWNRQVQKWIAEETGQPAWSEWYAGRPLLVTANDYGLRVYNGDTGVTVARQDGLRAVIAGAAGPLSFATSRSRRRRDDARDDDPQKPGQPGRRGDGADAAGGFAVADPRVVLYRGDARQDQGAGGRFRGLGAGRDRSPGGAGERATAAAAG